MTEMPISAALMLALLLSLAAALVVLLCVKRRLRVTLCHLREDAPVGVRAATVQADGVLEDVNHLGAALDDMTALFKAQTAVLDQACELAGLGTWVLLPDLESARISSHMRRIMGFSDKDEVVRIEALRDRILPEDRATFEDALNRAVQQKCMTEVEFRASDAVGKTRVFRARTGPGGAVPEGREGAISGVIQDITDLRHNETELARSLRLEHQAGEAARIGGWGYEIATRKLRATQETSDLVGAESDQTVEIEDVIARFEHEDERRRIERDFWTCAGAGTRFDDVIRFRRLDGIKTRLRIIGEAERDTSGSIIGIYGTLQDVGEMTLAKSTSESFRTLLRATLDALTDGFVICDRDGTVEYMNRRAHSLLGVPDQDLVGSDIRQALPGSLDLQFENAVTEALETDRNQGFESEIATPGQWVKIAVLPTPAGVAIYLEDVTETRDWRARLRLLDAAVAQLDDVVLITDAAHPDAAGPRVVFVNEAFTKMTGYSRDEILGATPRILQGPETERARLDEIRDAITARTAMRTELTNYRKDGTRFTVELDITPLFDADGACTHFVSVQRDTTERREKELALQSREERFRLASLASQDIVWDWDMQTGFIWNSNNSGSVFAPGSNLHVENIFEGRIENMLERIHPEDRAKIIESLNDALIGDAQAWRCEYRVRAQDGAWRQMTDRAFILRDEAGAPRRMVGAMSDVTDLRALDAQLHQAQKLETIGQLTAGIAHDFNNLLTIILGNCDILMDDIAEDPVLGPSLWSIENAAESGARLSGDLLAFSRRQPLEPRPTDVNELIRRSSGLFDRAVDARVVLGYDLTTAPTTAYVDPDKLQAALLNLVINAVAAIPQEGTITVRTRPTRIRDDDDHAGYAPGDYVEIYVIDDGSGMTPEVAERAFEPFFTTKEAGVGTGMGLSSVYGLVKQSGGHANLETAPGKGTTVMLSLPVTDAAQPAATTVPDREAALPEAGHRILVVEDDHDLRAFERRVLGRRGHDIVEAENGDGALDLLKTAGAFDLVVTDIAMPGSVDGVQLARKARAMDPAPKVLLTSGHDPEVLAKERDLHADMPMLQKPFRKADLVAKVEDVLTE